MSAEAEAGRRLGSTESPALNTVWRAMATSGSRRPQSRRLRQAGWMAAEEGESGGGEAEDVRGGARRCPGQHLGGHEARDCPPPARVRGGVASSRGVLVALRDAEVDEDGAALRPRGEDHVAGLDVTVDGRRGLAVEMVENLGDLSHPLDHRLQGEAGVSLLGQQPVQWRPLDPVHDQVVAVADDEVLADHAGVGVGGHPQQDARLVEDVAAVGEVVGVDAPHLDGHLPGVQVVEGAEHLALAAAADHLQDLVAAPQPPAPAQPGAHHRDRPPGPRSGRNPCSPVAARRPRPRPGAGPPLVPADAWAKG